MLFYVSFFLFIFMPWFVWEWFKIQKYTRIHIRPYVHTTYFVSHAFRCCAKETFSVWYCIQAGNLFTHNYIWTKAPLSFSYAACKCLRTFIVTKATHKHIIRSTKQIKCIAFFTVLLPDLMLFFVNRRSFQCTAFQWDISPHLSGVRTYSAFWMCKNFSYFRYLSQAEGEYCSYRSR